MKKQGWFGEKLPRGLQKSSERGEYIWRKDHSIMVYVPAGEFWRGSNNGDDDEQPIKKIMLGAYYVDKYELTNEKYSRFVQATGKHHPVWMEPGSKYNVETGSDNHYKKLGSALKGPEYPVIGVSWHDVMAYAKWAGKQLPTEAQWEKAARGGLQVPDWSGKGLIGLIENPLPQREYPWGNQVPDAGGYQTNYDTLYGTDDGYTYTSPVGSFKGKGDSPYRCCDMAGNVWEWCRDWWGTDYNTSPSQDPTGPITGFRRVCRGGSWSDHAWGLRLTYRNWNWPAYRDYSLGARLVLEP